MKVRCLAVAFVLAHLSSIGVAQAEGPPRPKRTYPHEAMLVTVENAATLQQALDTHRVVRLERGDYSRSSPIVLRSGQELYGIRSLVPPITIEPGASHVVLSNVHFEGGAVFPPSALVTRHNLFFELRGPFKMEGATLEENTFLGMEGGIFHIDTSAGGWLRNNRFIRIRSQGGAPLLTMIGDAAHQSYGNVFVWGNQLTQDNGAVTVTGQRDVTLVGWDDEAYQTTTTDPIFRFRGIDTLRLWALGGNSQTANQALFDIDAKEAQLSAVTMGGATPRPIVMSSAVERTFAFDTRPIEDGNPAGLRLFGESNINNNSGSPIKDHDIRVTGPLAAETGATLRTMYTTRSGEPWERPVFDPIPDPAGPNWNQDLASKPDSTDALQARIDAGPVVLLEPGIYYLSRPLKIRANTKLVGSGSDVTALVAKDPSIDLIVDDDRTNEEYRYHIEIVDLTLQGGESGVHFYGPPGQLRHYSEFLYSNLVFRNFRNAGFFVDQTGGFDNGILHHVDFVDCDTGFKQYADPDADRGGVNTGYVDKVMFYGNQFVGNRIGADLRAARANNLDSFVACSFQGNAEGAILAQSNNDLQLIHSDLVDNGGAPAVQGVADVISCYFRADARGVSMLSSGRIEGTRFERGTSTTAKIYEQHPDPFFAPNNAWANYSFDYLVNSSADDIDVGNVEFGIFLNDDLRARPDLSKPAAMAWLGTVTTLADGAVDPRAQLLVGKSYADPGSNGGDRGVADGGASSGGANAIDGGASSGENGPGANDDTSDSSSCGCIVGAKSSLALWSIAPAFALLLRRRRSHRIAGLRSRGLSV